MDTKKIGEFLKVLRKERGLTQEQLAEILLVSGRTISRWETETNMPDLSILIKMAEFYHKRREKSMPGNEAVLVKEQQPVNVFIADGNMQAEMIISTLKDNSIMAYGQDLGDAGFASVRYGMGRGIDDRIAIIVPSNKADSAKQVIKEMGLGQNVTH